MYAAMTRLFPFVHAVIALTVSNPRTDCVDVFSNTKTDQSVFGNTNSAQSVETNITSDDMTNNCLESNTLELSRRERAVLEFSHHHFAKKVYNACNRLMLRQFIISGSLNESVDFENNSQRLRWVLSRYQEYRERWECSAHEPSRMVAQFMKSMRRYLRCKRAIKAHDGWHLEIESANLLRIWKVFGKTTYLRLQCEFMETFYDARKLPVIYREIMRANAFCVKQSGTAVAFDEENEHYNAILK